MLKNINLIKVAKEVISVEIEGLLKVKDNIGDDFVGVVEKILDSNGRVIVCGMGKSGIVGKKISASLASTGTPSFFMHPGEAFHGDLGMVHPDDIFIAISNSGETEELLKLLPFLRENGNVLCAMTGNVQSTLAMRAHYHLDVGVSKEACPLQLAPTASTTACMAMGDALTVALMSSRNFQPENFARFHPGGSLGRRLHRKVRDEVITVDLPIVSKDTFLVELIQEMTRSTFGVAIVMDGDVLYGIVTDGDLRRTLKAVGAEVFSKTAAEICTTDPLSIDINATMQHAFDIMQNNKVTTLVVLNTSEFVGILKK